MIYCPICSTANRDGSHFCNECGSNLVGAALRCATCSSRNPPGSRFCNTCGSRLLPVVSDQDSTVTVTPLPMATPRLTVRPLVTTEGAGEGRQGAGAAGQGEAPPAPTAGTDLGAVEAGQALELKERAWESLAPEGETKAQEEIRGQPYSAEAKLRPSWTPPAWLDLPD